MAKKTKKSDFVEPLPRCQISAGRIAWFPKYNAGRSGREGVIVDYGKSKDLVESAASAGRWFRDYHAKVEPILPEDVDEAVKDLADRSDKIEAKANSKTATAIDKARLLVFQHYYEIDGDIVKPEFSGVTANRRMTARGEELLPPFLEGLAQRIANGHEVVDWDIWVEIFPERLSSQQRLEEQMAENFGKNTGSREPDSVAILRMAETAIKTYGKTESYLMERCNLKRGKAQIYAGLVAIDTKIPAAHLLERIYLPPDNKQHLTVPTSNQLVIDVKTAVGAGTRTVKQANESRSKDRQLKEITTGKGVIEALYPTGGRETPKSQTRASMETSRDHAGNKALQAFYNRVLEDADVYLAPFEGKDALFNHAFDLNDSQVDAAKIVVRNIDAGNLSYQDIIDKFGLEPLYEEPETEEEETEEVAA